MTKRDLHPSKKHWPRVWLAPMSGSSDAAMRKAACYWGAPAVVSEMVACDALLAERKDMVDRTVRHTGKGQWIVQLAARRPEDMELAAGRMVGLGVDVIDINMGCPSRQVTGGASGSALMRDVELAGNIMRAAIQGADGKPVTLKMRLGWDHTSLNAPELARIAQDVGIKLITVHGRTRCQFYKGRADWAAIADTVSATDLPVIANGDIASLEDAKTALELSGAYGVMIGRAALGRPWLIAQIAAGLAGQVYSQPDREAQRQQLVAQIEDSVSLYGEALGVKIMRKHIAAWLDYTFGSDSAAKAVRRIGCRIKQAEQLILYLKSLKLYADAEVA